MFAKSSADSEPLLLGDFLRIPMHLPFSNHETNFNSSFEVQTGNEFWIMRITLISILFPNHYGRPFQRVLCYDLKRIIILQQWF